MTFFEHLNSVNPFDSSHKYHCLPTSFKALDDIIGGFACGSLVTITGLPGARQDNFLYSMLMNWIKSDANLSVLYINLRGYGYSSRILHAIALNFPHNELFKGDKWGLIELSHYDALRELELTNKEELLRKFHIETFEYININTLQSLVFDYVREKGIKAVVIDGFLSILGDVFHTQEKDRHHISKSLKRMAGWMNIPVIVNTPLFLDKKSTDEVAHMPGLSDFRRDIYSGDIDYYSDLVLAVHSPEICVTQDDGKEIENNIIEVKVLKNIYGAENYTVKLHYDSNTRGVYSKPNRCCEIIKLNSSNYNGYIPIRRMLVCIYNEIEEWIEVFTDTKKVFYIDCSANGIDKEIVYGLLPVLKHCSLAKYDEYYSGQPESAYSVNIKNGVYAIAEDVDVITSIQDWCLESKNGHTSSYVFDLSKMLIENIGRFAKAITTSLINKVKRFSCEGWTLGICHGVSHWERVERNGLLLATDEVNKTVVRIFAYLHDKWRLDDGEDIDHGMRASENLIQLRETLFQWLTDDEFEQLYMACKLHTVCHSTGNPTIDTCFDADRLDLMRVGITPDPERMATERGKFYATNIEQFYADTKTNEEDLPF